MIGYEVKINNMISWHTEKRKVSELKSYHKNPRTITEESIKDLRKSISRFGVAEPIVINLDNTVIGGHARVLVLQTDNVEEVDCWVPNRMLTDKQVEELNIRLNKNVAGSWDFDVLANKFDVEDLKEWGFSNSELEMNVPEEPIGQKPEVEFTEELLEANNYVVLVFDNVVDFQAAEDWFGLKTVKALDSKEGYERAGIGRVVNGKDFLKRIFQ